MPDRISKSKSQISGIKATNVLKPEYMNVSKALSLKQLHEPLHLVKYKLEDHYARKYCVDFF